MKYISFRGFPLPPGPLSGAFAVDHCLLEESLVRIYRGGPLLPPLSWLNISEVSAIGMAALTTGVADSWTK